MLAFRSASYITTTTESWKINSNSNGSAITGEDCHLIYGGIRAADIKPITASYHII